MSTQLRVILFVIGISILLGIFIDVFRRRPFKEKVTGGFFVTKSNDLSLYAVITVGIGAPFSKSLVASLNCLQKS